MELLIQEWGSKAALFYCFLLLLLLTDSRVPDFSRSFIAVKPGLEPALLVGVDGEAHSPSSAFPGAEFLFALIPHSLLCLFVQIKRSVNNPGSYLFTAVLFVINWAAAPQRGEAVPIPTSGSLTAPTLFSVGWQCRGNGNVSVDVCQQGAVNSTKEAHPTTLQLPAAQLWIKTQPKQCKKGFQIKKIMKCCCKKPWNGIRSTKKSTVSLSGTNSMNLENF